MTALIGVAVILATVAISLQDAPSNGTVYSRPPMNLPVKKVVIHGRTIYVRPAYQPPIAQDSYRGELKEVELIFRVISGTVESNPGHPAP
uniref:COesterase domain-containing protein n=1 Tax=Steinernema glaseri TaxID=37863 RepID=A0A1I7Z401_9BILA